MDEYARIERTQKTGFLGIGLLALSPIVADAGSGWAGGVMAAVGFCLAAYAVARLA